MAGPNFSIAHAFFHTFSAYLEKDPRFVNEECPVMHEKDIRFMNVKRYIRHKNYKGHMASKPKIKRVEDSYSCSMNSNSTYSNLYQKNSTHMFVEIL